ncbi:hypothetical protein KIPB_006708 [Kipferlia bialata]|uniref:Uncharacterized protein n=1 Tax=Kipferlia bialata TaxID=797122 RepID=A0A9K3CXE7_9EUKA|nr:hypothetical protein KIPB_006708 [Kipferlia bialata]|eukprot:g6708.t1
MYVGNVGPKEPSSQFWEGIAENPSKHPFLQSLGIKVPSKRLRPVLKAVADGAWASIASDVGLPAIWGIRDYPKETERDRRERVRLEAEAKKKQVAASNKEKMLEKRRKRLEKKKANAARKAGGKK